MADADETGTADPTLEADLEPGAPDVGHIPDAPAEVDDALGETPETPDESDGMPHEPVGAPDESTETPDVPAEVPAEPGALNDEASEEPVEQVLVQPAAATAPESADATLVEAVSGGLTWIPFAVYLGLWFVLAGLSAYLLYGAGSDQPARWMREYEWLLWAGLGLVVLGPVLSIVVWLVARARRPKQARRGLFASAMTRGALAAFFGVVIWVSTLFVLELISTGWTL